jgi:nicotinate-nucleotide adenylyltransferase
MKQKRIGLLGGSFDPLHFGHLNMAIALSEAHRLDSVLFCPAYTSPFKIENPPVVSAEHRLAMVFCGIRGINQFSTLDWEIAQNGPSYTIDTIKKLKDESAAELFLLLGEDQLFDLHRWKNVEELFTLCKPLIASRDSKTIPLHHLSHALQALIAQGRTAIPMMDISSTAIRERLKHKRFCGHLVPALILDYIERHHLYM